MKKDLYPFVGAVSGAVIALVYAIFEARKVMSIRWLGVQPTFFGTMLDSWFIPGITLTILGFVIGFIIKIMAKPQTSKDN